MSEGPVVEILHSDDEGVIFNIKSFSSTDFHTVAYDPLDRWFCTCEQYRYRKKYCKHMQACADYAKANGIVIEDKNVFTGIRSSEVKGEI